MKVNLNIDTSIPITFEVMEDLEDKRFVKGKIWICHVGQNLNNSLMSKNVIENAIPSLANIPVLGFIEIGNDNQADFAGHEQRIIIDEDGARFEYMGRVYGIVPETNNAKFETKVCEDGVEREFLTAEVLMFTKFEDSINIITREGIHSQSMELYPDSIKGKFNKQGQFEFTDFKFEGLCLLGENVQPAMRGSVLELFNYQNFSASMQETLQEFNQFYSAQNEKGGKLVNEKLELFKKYPTLTEEDVADIKANLENYTLDEVDSKLKSIFESKENEQVEPEPKENLQTTPVEPETNPEQPEAVEPEATEEPEKEPDNNTQSENDDATPSSNFATTNGQLTQTIALAVRNLETYEDYWGDLESRYYYNDHDENRVYVSDAKDNWLPYGMNYTVNGDTVTLDVSTARRVKFVPQDLEDGQVAFSVVNAQALSENIEKAKQKTQAENQEKFTQLETALDEEKSKFESLENQFKEVNALYVAKIQEEDKEKLDKVFTQFAEVLTEDDMSPIRALYPEKSLEDIEDKLFALVGKKNAKFSTNKKQNVNVHIDLGTDKQEKHPLDGKSYKSLFEN